MNLSIIIVNFNSFRLISDCLRSIEAHAPLINYEILIVDNYSKAGEGTKMLEQFPSVKWIQMDYNSGFARANNEGIRQAKGDTVLLLNPDTLIPDDAISNCYRLLSASPYIACGVQLLNTDSSPQISGNYFVKGGLNYLLPLPFLGKAVKAAARLFSARVPHVLAAASVVEVDWINGAFLMVKKQAIDQAGPLDEDFFLYAEETEWCARLKKVGRLCIFGSISVFHLQGISSNEAFSSSGEGYYNLFDRKGLQIMLSNLVRIRKQYGNGWFLFMLFFYTFDIPVFLLGILCSFFLPESKRTYRFSQWTGFTGNVFYLWSKVPVIISNQPYFYKVL